MAETRRISTAEELFAMPSDGFRYELVHGELRRMSPDGPRHGWIALRFGIRLGTHVEAHDLGVALVECGFILSRDPDLVRAPDVCFVRKDRVPEGGVPVKYWPGTPDLVVEVVSPGDTYAEVQAKAEDWLHYGTAVVVVVEPARRRAVVHHSGGDVAILTEEDVFEAADVVPGFRLPIRELFAL